MSPLRTKLAQALRWSERYTKTDMIYLFKGGSLLGLGQLINASAGFILSLVFANLLPKEAYGAYRFVLSAAALLSIATLSGMGTALTRAVARGFDGAIGEALQTKIRWGLLATAGSVLLAAYYFVNDNVVLGVSFVVVALCMPVMEAFGVYDSFLQGKKAFGISIRYAAASKIASVAALSITAVVTHNVPLLLLAYFLPFSVARIIFTRRTRAALAQNDLRDSGMGTYGKHLSAMGILGVIANQLDRLLVFSLLGSVELAVYAVIAAPIEQIKAVVDNVAKIALPKFAEREAASINITIWRRMSFLLAGLALISIAYWVIAPLIFAVLFPQYAEYASLSRIFGLSIISFALFIPLQILQSMQATKELYMLNIVTSVVQIGLSIVFVVSFGLIGVVAARVIARLFNLSIYLVALRLTVRTRSS